MANDTKVFISWSGPKSNEFASYLYEWMPTVIHNIKPWASFNTADLPLGPNDHNKIIDAAKNSDICLSIITPDSLSSPWLLFEPGIFYGQDKAVLCLLCGGIKHDALKAKNYPLSGYHGYPDTIVELMKSINSYADNPVKESNFIDSLNERKAGFIEKYNSIFSGPPGALPEVLSDATLEETIRTLTTDG